MSAIHDAVHQWVAAWGAFLGSTIVLAVAFAMLGLLVARFSRRLSSRSRHFLLSLGLAAPAAGLLLIPTGIADAIRSLASKAEGAPTVGAGVVTRDGLEFAAIHSGGWAVEWACAALAIWSIGFLALVLWRTVEWARWRTLARAADSIVHPRTRAAYESASDRSGRATGLVVSAACTAPMVVGILRPAVVVPGGYGRGMAFEEMESVFLHELEHVARRDNFTAAMAELIGAIFWFDPLHWVARRRLLELREAACDEGVLARGCGAEPYLNALAKTCRAAVSPAVACMADLRIRERMESIMSYRDVSPRWVSERAVRALGIFILALAGLGIALFAPADSLAEPSGQHRMSVSTRPGPDGVLYLDGEVRTSGGELVMVPRTTATPGQPVVMTTQKGERLYRLTVTAAADGSGLAKLEVLDGGELVDSVLQTFPPAAADPTPAPRAAPRSGYERIGPDVTPPRIITRVDPVFPPEAKAARISGIVIVQALIGKDGLVHEATALKRLPFGLDQAALDAVRQWTFTPALRDGEPVAVVFNVTINFKFADENEAKIQPPPDGDA